MHLFLVLSCTNDNLLLDKQVTTTVDESPEQAIPGGDTGQTETTRDPCESLTLGDESDFIPQGDTLSTERNRCQINWHASAGAKGTTIEVKLDSWAAESDAIIRITDLLDQTIIEGQGNVNDVYSFSPTRSGEFFIRSEYRA